jgi:hypothetical protein
MNYEWVRLYVETELREVARDIGRETGCMERRLTEQMHAHVREHVDELRQLVQIQKDVIAGLTERLAAVESMFARPQASVVDLKQRAS